jgi:hypothetical protein
VTAAADLDLAEAKLAREVRRANHRWLAGLGLFVLGGTTLFVGLLHLPLFLYAAFAAVFQVGASLLLIAQGLIRGDRSNRALADFRARRSLPAARVVRDPER